MQSIIFTDLDGTLLNHHDYSFHEANEALLKIRNQNIPLIFTTSKTKAEAEILQKKLNIKEPFIIENGAAVFFPKNYRDFDLKTLTDYDNYYIIQLGKPYQDIIKFYNQYKDAFVLKGFSDMTLSEVMKLTQLNNEQAKLCQERDFTEPFIIEDESKIEELRTLAQPFGIKITKGGRFYHLIGENQDKGKAVLKTIEVFQKALNEPFQTIALGDGENDIEMLRNVDIPIVIQNHKGEYISFEAKNIERSTFQSSKGWNEMLLKHL